MLAEYRKNITVIESTGIAQKYQLERAAAATAEANIIQLEADVLKIIKDEVKVNKTNLTMNESQLVTYQKLMMLQSQKEARGFQGGLRSSTHTQRGGGIPSRARLRSHLLPGVLTFLTGFRRSPPL